MLFTHISAHCIECTVFMTRRLSTSSVNPISMEERGTSSVLKEGEEGRKHGLDEREEVYRG